MEDHHALTALSQALKLEEEGHAFYLRAAEETYNDKGKSMFLSLAADEARHADIVRRQIHEIEGSGSYVLLPELDVQGIDLDAKLFPPEREAVDARIGLDPNELDALTVALENEIRSYDLYRMAALAVADEAGERMYRWLAGAELTHFNLLMSNYEALIAQGGWV